MKGKIDASESKLQLLIAQAALSLNLNYEGDVHRPNNLIFSDILKGSIDTLPNIIIFPTPFPAS